MKSSVIDKHRFLIDYIRRNRETSRNQITKHFNMNAATVGNIVDRLLNEEIIIESDEVNVSENSGAGRPPIPLRINPDAGYFIGINFCGDSYFSVITDFSGKAVSQVSGLFPPAVDKGKVLSILIAAVRELLKDSSVPKHKIGGIGIGAPGVVNSRTNCSIKYPRIKHWENINFEDSIGSVFSLPVFADHNSNCFAAGEANIGSARHYQNMVDILIRTGISMGIARNREIFSMSEISAGELGHITVNPKGGKCWCGSKGCLETAVSGWAFNKKLKKAMRQGIIDKLYTSEEFAGLAASGNQFAVEILGDMFDHLGIAVANVISLMRPEAVVINGCFNAADKLMLARINEIISKKVHNDISTTEIIVSQYDDSIGACGAALMAISRLYNPFYHLEATGQQVEPAII